MSQPSTDRDRIARIKIVLNDIKPVIWRRVEVPLTSSLKALHEVIQAVMLFENRHLFQFDVGEGETMRRYGIPSPSGDWVRIYDARSIKFGKLVKDGIERFSYTYDFGDDWRHTITIEDVAAAIPRRSIHVSSMGEACPARGRGRLAGLRGVPRCDDQASSPRACSLDPLAWPRLRSRRHRNR